ncbi:hypothetical protein AB2C39_33605, partial [Pseudomonas aeruginosa]
MARRHSQFCFALFLLASPALAEVSVLTSIKPLQ